VDQSELTNIPKIPNFFSINRHPKFSEAPSNWNIVHGALGFMNKEFKQILIKDFKIKNIKLTFLKINIQLGKFWSENYRVRSEETAKALDAPRHWLETFGSENIYHAEDLNGSPLI
jgi:predicted nuclease of restriction endonuclease-like RecB superfamily